MTLKRKQHGGQSANGVDNDTRSPRCGHCGMSPKPRLQMHETQATDCASAMGARQAVHEDRVSRAQRRTDKRPQPIRVGADDRVQQRCRLMPRHRLGYQPKNIKRQVMELRV